MFTIPSTGIYFIVASITATSKEDNKYLIFHLIKTTSTGTYWTPIELCDSGSYTRLSGSCMVPLDKGTILTLKASTNNSSNLSVSYRFSIVKLV